MHPHRTYCLLQIVDGILYYFFLINHSHVLLIYLVLAFVVLNSFREACSIRQGLCLDKRRSSSNFYLTTMATFEYSFRKFCRRVLIDSSLVLHLHGPNSKNAPCIFQFLSLTYRIKYRSNRTTNISHSVFSPSNHPNFDEPI